MTDFIRTKRKWGRKGNGKGRPYFASYTEALDSARKLVAHGKGGDVDVWVRVATVADLRAPAKAESER